MAERMAQTGQSGHKPGGLAARRAAAAVLARVVEDGEALGEALAHEEPRLGALAGRDRALAERIVRTALRRKGQIDDALGRFMKKPPPKKARVTRAALLAGAAQILFMRVPAHAAIDTAVRLVKADRASRGLSGLVNAVLRNVSRKAGEFLSAQGAGALNIPPWLLDGWRAAYGEEAARAIGAALLEEPPLDLSLKVPEEAEKWAKALDGLVLPTGTVRIENPSGAMTELPGFDEGAYWAQDAAAALPARLLGDAAGQRVLDVCAAPGGKTAQLAASGAFVTALDISQKRLERLKDNLNRLKLEARTVVADALTWTPEESFDAILLDAPCSATGTARRHPDVLLRKTPGLPAGMARLQMRMLERALEWVKPGGLVVYCVCSLQREEGEELIARFLEACGDRARLVPLTAGDVAGQEQFITAQGMLRTLPSMNIGESKGLDGFFAARLRRL